MRAGNRSSPASAHLPLSHFAATDPRARPPPPAERRSGPANALAGAMRLPLSRLSMFALGGVAAAGGLAGSYLFLLCYISFLTHASPFLTSQ